MKALCLVLWIALIPCGAYAQDHQADVALVKSQLIAQGVDLSGPCGAFQITKRVAWQLKGEGYGLLGGKTTGQNGCAINGDKYAVDWLLKPSGHGVDILGDAGGENAPLWREEEAPAQFYRPAFDPGDSPAPTPTPQPPVFDPTDLLNQIAALRMELSELKLKLSEETATRIWQDDDLGKRFLQHKEQDPHKTTCKASIFGIPVACRLE